MRSDVWKVVVIDDSPDDRAEVRGLLLKGSDRRYQFTEAETGEAGVRAVLDASSDCVVLDYNLPDMDALGVLAGLVGPDGATTCPVVVLTGSADTDLGRTVLRAGAQDFLGKSWMTAESLTRAVENAAERWAMARELHARSADLRASDERLRLAVEVAGMGVNRIDYGTHTVVLDAIAAALFGLESGVPLPRSVIHATFHPDDKDEIVRRMHQSLDPTGEGTFSMEHRVVHPDGSVHWLFVKKHVMFAETAGVRRPVTGVLAAVDISDRKRVAEALRESEERYRAATVAVSDVIWTNNADGVMEGEQRGWGELTGQSREEYQGYGWSKAVHPEDAQPTLDEWKRTVAEKRTFVFEHRVRRHDGEWRVCSIRAVPVFNADGAIREWVGVHRDITEQKRDEEKLRQLAADLSDADRRKDEFLATLAHELRNPLAPIRTGLDVMRMSPSGTAAVEKVRAIMERQLGHMVRLVDDLMDVSRISRGKVELKVARVQARAVLDHAVEASRPLIEADGHALVVDAVSESAWVDGDLTRLAQVVSNLLNNAAKYTPAGGRIELAAHVEAGEVVISVTDNGAGISADMLPKVFDLFAQVDRTLDRAQGGLGIGLSVVRKLVELHDGTVTAASPGLGLGSTFTVRLPLAATEEESAAADDPSTDRPTDSLRVLVVDDNVDGAELLSVMLERAGHEARAVHDGLAALAAARDVRPDVVFLDIGLPGMDGHEVARRFRADAAFAGIVLVALTGWGSEDDKRKSREAGFDHHVTKPIDFKRVRELFAGINGRER